MLIDRLQYAGRPLLYSGLLLAELVALALIGVAAAGFGGRRRSEPPPRFALPTRIVALTLFAAVDGYTESIPMAISRQPTTLVAYQMNGAALPDKHGFPARVILAGHYGMKNPKWLTTITVAPTDDPGFWEQQGWDESAIVRADGAGTMQQEKAEDSYPLGAAGLETTAIRVS